MSTGAQLVERGTWRSAMTLSASPKNKLVRSGVMSPGPAITADREHAGVHAKAVPGPWSPQPRHKNSQRL